MKTNRRQFFKTADLGAGALGLLAQSTLAQTPSILTKQRTMRLGLVTYNLAADWDIATIIKNCQDSGLEGVELRTSHAHKVEVNLTKVERAEVKARFQNSKVQLMGLGSAFDYHTPDQVQLRKDIEATKEYIVLSQDVGSTGGRGWRTKGCFETGDGQAQLPGAKTIRARVMWLIKKPAAVPPRG